MLAPLRSRFTRVAERFTGGARRTGEPPLVRPPVPFLGHALAMGRDLTELLRACQREHGDVFTLLVAGRRVHFIVDPFSFPQVLKAQDNLTFHEIGDEIGQTAFGYTPLHAQSDHDALQAAYHDHLKNAALGPLTERMEERLRAAFERFVGDDWREDGLFEFTSRCMYTAGVEVLFGVGSVDDRALADFRRMDRWFALLAAGVPAAALPGVVRARDRMRRRVDVLRPDASAFVRVRDQLFERITTRSNRQHMQLVMVWASQANSLPAAFWLLAQLLHDAGGRAAVIAEVEALGLGDLKRLPRLYSSVCEALRLSSNNLSMRLVKRDCQITLAGDRTISLRAGDRVALCPQVTHRDPEVFEAPEEFRYDRFLGEGGPRQFSKRGQRLPLAFMPFGGGVSMCPGRFLASNEMMQFAGLALTTLEIELLEPGLPPLDKSRAGLGVLSPTRDIRCRIRRRRTAAA
jgi:cytochrome P450